MSETKQEEKIIIEKIVRQLEERILVLEERILVLEYKKQNYCMHCKISYSYKIPKCYHCEKDVCYSCSDYREKETYCRRRCCSTLYEN
jgi:hypothetical protein